MDESIAAFTYKIAPPNKAGEWHQRSLKRVLSKWGRDRPNDLETILNSDGFGVAVGVRVFPSNVGQYGYDTGLRFKPDIEKYMLSDIQGGDLVKPFYEDWVRSIQDVIREDQEQTMFSAKEFATFFAHRNPANSEARNADALEISIGTYRGKVGRIKSKLKEANATVRLAGIAPESGKSDAWNQKSYQAPLSVLHRVDESRLPINSISSVTTEGVTVDDLPIDELIKE